MRIVTSDRRGAVPARVRAAVEQRLADLGRRFDVLSEAEIEFDQEGLVAVAGSGHITLKGRGQSRP